MIKAKGREKNTNIFLGLNHRSATSELKCSQIEYLQEYNRLAYKIKWETSIMIIIIILLLYLQTKKHVHTPDKNNIGQP